jgi:meiotically up-regulated gene 157 (Mug157) protein
MVLSSLGNPYFLQGEQFKGIGGPHIGTRNAWPMSVLVQIMTSDDDDEITELLEMLKMSTAQLGLMHETGILVPRRADYSECEEDQGIYKTLVCMGKWSFR